MSSKIVNPRDRRRKILCRRAFGSAEFLEGKRMQSQAFMCDANSLEEGPHVVAVRTSAYSFIVRVKREAALRPMLPRRRF